MIEKMTEGVICSEGMEWPGTASATLLPLGNILRIKPSTAERWR